MGSHIGLELPFRSGVGSVRISQGFGNGDHGNGSSSSWNKYFYYAVDLKVNSGTAVVGEGTGSIIAFRMTTPAGQYGPPDGLGNYITVKYADGAGNIFYATYMHLNPSSITSTSINLGQTFAYSGNTGASTGPHLHVTYGANKVTLDSSSDMSAGLPASTYHVVMADGSRDHNPHGSPVFFTTATSDRGFLLAGSYYQSDNGVPSSQSPSVVRAFDQVAGRGQWSEMNGWFFASDPNPGDRVSYWLMYDSNSSSSSGHFWSPPGWIHTSSGWQSWGGGQVPANTIVLVTAASMNQAQFVGATVGGTHDTLYVQAWDGHQYSGWKGFVVTTSSTQVTGAAMQSVEAAALIASPSDQGAPPLFVFAPPPSGHDHFGRGGLDMAAVFDAATNGHPGDHVGIPEMIPVIHGLIA